MILFVVLYITVICDGMSLDVRSCVQNYNVRSCCQCNIPTISLSTIMQRPSNHIIQLQFNFDASILNHQRHIKYHSQPYYTATSTLHETKFQHWYNFAVPSGMCYDSCAELCQLTPLFNMCTWFALPRLQNTPSSFHGQNCMGILHGHITRMFYLKRLFCRFQNNYILIYHLVEIN